MKELNRTEFGNPHLREVATPVTTKQILSAKMQKLITNMFFTLTNNKRGVGLAAPQVGQDIALSVICIQPTKHRPKVRQTKLVIINPVISQTYGRKSSMWEGCLSSGQSPIFAKVPRYSKIKLKYLDEQAKSHHKVFSGLLAQVIQHEVDHLKGILFVDRVKDTSTYMTLKEYKKRIVKKKEK